MGIRKSSTNDHMTAEICLPEITKMQRSVYRCTILPLTFVQQIRCFLTTSNNSGRVSLQFSIFKCTVKIFAGHKGVLIFITLLIYCSEFDILLHQLDSENSNNEIKDLLMHWYKCDDNAIPPVRILQPVSSQIPEYTNTKGKHH